MHTLGEVEIFTPQAFIANATCYIWWKFVNSY